MTTDMFRKIEKCRVCGNTHYDVVLDLGDQYISGVFPKEEDDEIPRGPLRLVKCSVENGGCGHVQLEHTFDLPTMYGDNYGYRSGLNSSMVKHLQGKAHNIKRQVDLKSDDIIVDIAGNDGTFLGFFEDDYQRLIIDPTSEKFSKFIPSGVDHIADFFSKKIFKEKYSNRKAKIVTSFSMFYDLEDPCAFAKEVAQILSKEGIWVLEQSYVALMLKANSFDTVCHEHLSYYAMTQLKFIMEVSGLKIVDFEFNDVNGGSISLSVARQDSQRPECTDRITEVLHQEKRQGLQTLVPWQNFADRIKENEKELLKVIDSYSNQGITIAALGASTKGNVLLQTWPEVAGRIKQIGDVNTDKHGCYTPGSIIPIIDEDLALEKYDVFIVLPWHFKNFFINNRKFRKKTLIFPLPTVETIRVNLV
jgi:hypothetical protein|tara:strand:+ start:740 stop:1996 length:1257 start_codon:yes stop_codon:yes gene_type:complete